MLKLLFIFISLIYVSEQQSIKLKPVYLNESTNEIRVLNKTQILITFDRIKHKRIQLVPIVSKQSNKIHQNIFFINNTDLTLNANLSSSHLDREYLLDVNQCLPDDEITESDCVLKLKIAAYDVFNQMQSIYIVPIVILDLNDQKPQFRQPIYHVNISENQLSVTHIPLDAPFDSDSIQNGIKQCKIESHTNKLFEAFFNQETQRLFLVVNKPLDRENISQYDLILMCTDNITFVRTRLHIDVLDANDNQPYFKQNLTLKQLNENTYEKHLVDLLALDADDSKTPNGQLIYSLPYELNSNEIINDLFEINQQNGSLTIRSNASLDYEKKTRYNIKVKVQDQGANSIPAYADVQLSLLDENDNPPQGHFTFTDKILIKQDKLNSTIWVFEELPVNQTILGYLTITDIDTPNANGNSLSAELLNHTNVFKLIPIIEEYDNLYYSLQLINRIDREQISHYDLKFKLSDNSNNTSKQQISYLNLRIVLLDINDNRPQFQHVNLNSMYQFDLSENKLYSELTRIKAIDLDLDKKLRYEILPLTSDSLLPPFEINPLNGDLKQLKELDREESSKYAFKVRCYDSGQLYSDVIVQINVIDVNDNLPIFVNWQPNGVTFDLDEEQPTQTLIGNVKALDPDLNSSVFYYLKPDWINNYFQINNSTGSLMTKIKIDADLIKQKSLYSLFSNLVNNSKFVFDIIAVDLDRSLGPQLDKPLNEQKLKVEISLNDLNDNKPLITSNTPNATVLNLNLTNCGSNNSLVVTQIQSIDLDRDFSKAQNKHLFRLNYIKRLSWTTLYSLTQAVNQSFVSLSQKLFELKQQDKSMLNLNLRQIFVLKNLNTISNEETNLNKADLLIKKNCDLNSGVYLFGMQIIDRSTDAMQRSTQLFETKRKKSYWRTEFQFKFYLFNTSLINLTDLELDELNSVVNAWLSRELLEPIDDNGDDSNAQISMFIKPSIARNILFANNSSTQVFIANVKAYFIANSSYSIIVLISFFLVLAILLISLISYKHYKASNQLMVKDTKFNSSLNTDETNSTNSNTCLHKPSNQTSSTSTTASTNLSINSLNKRSNRGDDESTKENYTSPSNSFFESYHQPATSITEHQIKCLIQKQQNNEEEVEERVNSNVSDSSFTVITTSITPVSATTTTILASATQVAASTTNTSSPKKQVVLSMPPVYSQASYKQLTPLSPSSAYLTTFQMASQFKPTDCIAIVEHDNDDDEDESLVKAKSNNSNDHGYCGSSDYSDNSILTKNNFNKKPVYKQQQHRPAKYVTNNKNSLTSSLASSCAITEAGTATSVLTSASSTTSSPLFNNVNRQSQPISHQLQLQQQPIVTNLYPPYTFNSQDYLEGEDLKLASTSSKTDSVNVYLERFERIYNSTGESHATTSQRTSFKSASYSYV